MKINIFKNIEVFNTHGVRKRVVQQESGESTLRKEPNKTSVSRSDLFFFLISNFSSTKG